MDSNIIQNLGHSYSILPVHQVRTVGQITWAHKQPMKALTIFNDDIYLTQTTCALPSQNNRLYAYSFSTIEMDSDIIKNMGHSYNILPVHQVRTVG